MVRPRQVLGFALIALVMLAGLLWSVLSTTSVEASGPGVLHSGTAHHFGPALHFIRRPASADF